MRSISNGFTLIEVLISSLILSIGVLGVTGLQLRALDANRHAIHRVEAGQLASDLIDRIEVNAGTTYGPTSLGDAPVSAIDCTANNCSPAQMAIYDLTQWQCSIRSTADDGSDLAPCVAIAVTGVLPQGSSSVLKTGNEYQIEIRWLDSKNGRTSSVKLFAQVE